MFWTVEQSAFYLRLEPHQVYYLLAMGYIEAIKTGLKLWRVVPEAVKEYAERHHKTKTGETAGYFVYPGNGGVLFDSLPDRTPHDPSEGTAGLERRGRNMVYSPGRPAKILLKELKSVIQFELFSA
jgi:excisionase family DNA binding protein